MIKVQKNLLVIDTETTGDFGQPLIHDIGWQVVDKDFKVLVSRRFLVKEPRMAKWITNYSEFYRSKAHLYETAIENGEVETLGWHEITKILLKDITSQKVKVISAYNIAFDYKALKFTNAFLKGDSKLMEKIDKRYIMCLWQLACDSVLNTQEFKEWARLNKKISQSGNYQTSAEVTYAYIINEPNFEEEHTALEDVKIEVEILKHIIQNYDNEIKYGLAYSCWQKIQDKKKKDE